MAHDGWSAGFSSPSRTHTPAAVQPQPKGLMTIPAAHVHEGAGKSELLAFLKALARRTTPSSLAHPADAANMACPRCKTDVHARRVIVFKCGCGAIGLQIDFTDDHNFNRALAEVEVRNQEKKHDVWGRR